jgi:hypothetical protein
VCEEILIGGQGVARTKFGFQLQFVTSTLISRRGLFWTLNFYSSSSPYRFRTGHSMRPIRAVFAICALLVLPAPAKTHTHVDPDGSAVAWYPWECCHDRDCRPVATVRIAPQGLWMTTVDGFTVLVGDDEERRPSHDMRWHVCFNEDIMHNTIIQCVFESPSSKPLRDHGQQIAMP